MEEGERVPEAMQLGDQVVQVGFDSSYLGPPRISYCDPHFLNAILSERQSDKSVVRVLPGYRLVRAPRNRRLPREVQSQFAGHGYQSCDLIAGENLPGQTVYVRTVSRNLLLPIVCGDEKQPAGSKNASRLSQNTFDIDAMLDRCNADRHVAGSRCKTRTSDESSMQTTLNP